MEREEVKKTGEEGGKSSSSKSELIRKLAPSGDHEQALQFAFYNTLLFVLVGVCLVALYAVYRIFSMFLSPIIWATLVGTVLFPLKRRISHALNAWLSRLRDSHTPFVLGLVMLPYSGLTHLSDRLWTFAASAGGMYAALAYVLLKVLDHGGTLVYLLNSAARLYALIDRGILFFSTRWMLLFTGIYTVAYVCWLLVQADNVHKKSALTALSLLAEFTGPARVVVFAACSILLLLISAGLVGAEQPQSQTSEEPPGVSRVLEPPTPFSGDTFIRLIGAGCILLSTARHDFLLLVIAVPLLFAFLRKLGDSLGVFDAVNSLASTAWTHASGKLTRIVNIIVAGPLRKFVFILFTSDQKLLSVMTSAVDVLSTITVIIMLALGGILGVIFVGLQVHAETAHLMRLTASLVAQQPEWLAAAARNFTEGQIGKHDMDHYVEEAYLQGRVWLSSNVRSLIHSDDPGKAEAFEKQTMQLVDRLYELWEQRRVTVSDSAVARPDWLTQLRGVADLTTLRDQLIVIVQDNMKTLIGIGQSVWTVVAMNVTLFASFFMAFAEILLGFGLDLLNFLIGIIVFLTALYYLLSSSKRQWLPMEWLKDALPTSAGQKGADISTAIENSISGVFVLSSKMAIFYGLYTWFIHTLFDLNIVFVPSILAAIFAAIPLMAPYMVAGVGIVELAFVRGETAAAIVFVIASLAPLMFADAAFYREIKGSHPYVTALAIVGGMYWLGLQGAIFGPIILCVMLVLINVYAQLANGR